jgi:hypothetical protein
VIRSFVVFVIGAALLLVGASPALALPPTGPDSTACATAIAKVTAQATVAAGVGDKLAAAEATLASVQADVETKLAALIKAGDALASAPDGTSAPDLAALEKAVKDAEKALDGSIDALAKAAAATPSTALSAELAAAEKQLEALIKARITACAPPVEEEEEPAATPTPDPADDDNTGGGVTVVPNDPPDTGDGSTESAMAFPIRVALVALALNIFFLLAFPRRVTWNQ